MSALYVLQLNPDHPRAWEFCVSWPGFWAGIGYVENKKDAVKFHSKRDATNAASSTLAGLNGLLKIVSARP